MNIKNAFAGVLEREMSRKEFLQNLGVGLVMLCGGSFILQALNGGGRSKTASGYGDNPYGGRR